MNNQLTRDTWVMLAIVVGIVTASLVLVFLPQGRTLKELKTKMVSLDQKLTADSQEASVVPQLLQEVQTMKGRYQDFDRRLPQRKELGQFLGEISSNLAAENLTNQLIEPGSPTRSELFHTLPIVMRFRGSYLDMARFLSRLDSMERLSRVEKLRLVRNPGEDALEAELQINIYFTES